MYEIGRTAHVTAEMCNYNYVPGETKWMEYGQLRLSTGEVRLYSGLRRKISPPHTEGLLRTGQSRYKSTVYDVREK